MLKIANKLEKVCRLSRCSQNLAIRFRLNSNGYNKLDVQQDDDLLARIIAAHPFASFSVPASVQVHGQVHAPKAPPTGMGAPRRVTNKRIMEPLVLRNGHKQILDTL
ncbi:hypothetical protein ACLKA7_009566 [Drosophila subpalustris]